MIFKIAPSFILFTFACGLAVNQNYPNENGSQSYYSGPAKQYQGVSSDTYSAEEEKYEDAYPKYEFKYAVNDEQSGDTKSQHEVRDGDKVRGVYTLMDTDGFQRIVEYTADDKDGFVAVVRREPIAGYKPAQQSQANYQQHYDSYATKPQPAQQNQANQQQHYESYAAKLQPSQASQTNHQQKYESYAAKVQPEIQHHQEYKPVQTQKYVQPAPQISSGYDKNQEGKYYIKYSTAAPEIVTAAPEYKYQYVAPVSEGKYVTPSSVKTNQNQNQKAVSHVNNYFETPKTEEYNTAPEYNYGYDY